MTHAIKFSMTFAWDDKQIGLFIEQLRYAQIINVEEYDQTGENNRVAANITIYPPRNVDGKRWQEMNIRRMRTFGIDPQPHNFR